MSSPTPHDVLVAHQRNAMGTCHCSWAEFGGSHCQHVLDALDEAGWVIVRKRPKREVADDE